MILEESFGTIPLKKQNSIWITYLVKNRSGNHWGFPKGHANLSETKKDAAIRELKEEANLEVVKFLAENPLIEQYTCTKNSEKAAKKVYYYIVEVTGDGKVTSDEILDGKWVDIKEAKNSVTYEQSKVIAMQVDFLVQNL